MLKFNDYLKEAALSAKQKKIAAIAGDKDKIDAADLAALRAGKKPVEEASCSDKDMKKEELVGKQHKLDKNHNGKLDAQDFKMLRKEEAEQIDEERHVNSFKNWNPNNTYANNKYINIKINHSTAQLKKAEEAKKKGNMSTYHKHMERHHGYACDFHRRAAVVDGQRHTPDKACYGTYVGHARANAAHAHKARRLKEEVEQIDEISKAKLVRYIDKASQDVHNKAMAAGEKQDKPGKASEFIKSYQQSGKRQAGITKAAVKLAKEEVELDEGRVKELAMDLKDMSHDEFHKQYGKPKSHFDSTNFKKPVEPGKGMDRAKALAQRGMQSLSKEEVERIEEKLTQLDELSKKTLGSYAHGRMDDLTQKGMDDDHDDIKPKHIKGIERAAHKLGDKKIAKHAKAAIDHAKDFAHQYHHNMDDREAVYAQDNMDDSKGKAANRIDKALKKEERDYVSATLKVMDEGKIDNLRDAQKLRQDTQSAYEKDYKPDTSHPHIQVVKGSAYGGANQKDDEGDEKPDETKEKKGRGRPAGSKSGARQKGGGHEDGGIPVHNLNLPKSYK